MSTIVCSAGSRASSSTHRMASAPAKWLCALVGPRPNCSLCNATIAFDTFCRIAPPNGGAIAVSVRSVMTTPCPSPSGVEPRRAEEDEEPESGVAHPVYTGCTASRPPWPDRRPTRQGLEVSAGAGGTAGLIFDAARRTDAPARLPARRIFRPTPRRPMSALWSAPRLDDPWAERDRVSLLRVDPALRDAVAPEDVALAEHALVAPCLRLPRGRWAPEMVAVGGAHPFAALLLDGVVTYEITLAGRRSAQLLGPGDLFRPWASTETSLRYTSSWSASGNAAIALLDDHFLVAARRWPRLANVVYDRLADQMEVGAVRTAIVALPRVEQRVLALFWQLADRWGVVRPDGVVVRLALTHAVIGELVGARRPTVSLALQALAEDGLLRRQAGDAWLLHHDSFAALGPDGLRAGGPPVASAPPAADDAAENGADRHR